MTSEEEVFLHPAPLDYTWTSGNDSSFTHLRAIAAGASGEVHEVSPRFKDIRNELRAVAKLCKPNMHQNIVSVFRYGQFSSSYYFLDMEPCDLNLESWIERKWSPAIEQNLPYFTENISPRIRMAQVWNIME